jgi:type IV fimbrial biogenesis protein FimT
MRSMEYRSHGFTLMELMVSLAIAGIVLGIAAPSFTEFLRNNRLTNAANDFLSAAQVARTEAIKRQVAVAVCSSTNPQIDAADCADNTTFTGWIVFEDTNNNCLREPAETKLKGDGVLPATVLARSNGNCMSFAPTGFLQTVPARTTASRTVYCDARGIAPLAGQIQSAGRGIFVTNTGRSRVSRDRSSGTTTDIGTWGLACP